jgi:hypothetical protein
MFVTEQYQTPTPNKTEHNNNTTQTGLTTKTLEYVPTIVLPDTQEIQQLNQINVSKIALELEIE